MSPLVDLDQARAAVLAGRDPLPPVEVKLADALGCVSATPIFAAHALPPFTNSAMDGYALRASDTTRAPVELQVVGEVMAGDRPALAIEAGQAARIMTGGVLPTGADAVCIIEETRAGPDRTSVLIETTVSRGANIRQAGEDVLLGDEVLPARTQLGPSHIGLLASLGVDVLAVHPRPRVGVLSTGSELVEGPGALQPGQIRDSNRISLLALLHESGFVAVDLGLVADDEELVKKTLRQGASRCDALVTSGGVSVGDKDVVKAVLGELAGDSMRWMQVAVKPAKPFAFGELVEDGTPLFALPGNPVSALVSFELFARPALRRMAGFDVLERPVLSAIADQALKRPADGKVHFQRVVARQDADGELHVSSAGGQGSHQLFAMARANALAVLGQAPGVAPGDRVAILLLEPDSLAPPGLGSLP